MTWTRPKQPGDAETISQLMDQLGHHSTVEHVVTSLKGSTGSTGKIGYSNPSG